MFITPLILLTLLSQPQASCPVTTTVRAEPPQDPTADPLGIADWYVNEDRSIWVFAQHWPIGKALKTMWIRPAGVFLTVEGRRLDADAPALQASIPRGYGSLVQPSYLTFPTAGCWEVTAIAGTNRLQFVTRID